MRTSSLAFCVVVALGCGVGTNGGGADAGAITVPGPWMTLPGASCNARERRYPIQPTYHVPPDAGLAYISNPPSSGPHFDRWARWGANPDIPRGNYVHNLEHGGVAYLYRCAAGQDCNAARDALAQATAGIPMDRACRPTAAEPARVRVVITNDPLIESPVAAAAWGWVYTADCVDPPSLRTFYTAHAGMAPEDFCFEGSVP